MLNTAVVRIDPGALRANYRKIKQMCPGAQVVAVVKSDAYGHGLEWVADTLRDADAFALIQIDDASRLRQKGIRRPIILLEGVADRDELAAASALGLTVVVRSHQQLAMLEQERWPDRLTVWLKVNTGMNRFGFRAGETAAIAARLRALPGVRLQALMSHFACADDPAVALDPQWRVFEPLVRQIGLPFSIANSAAILRDAAVHGGWVRAGAMLYGNNPFEEIPPGGFDFAPVMRLDASIIGISELGRGEALGYGGTFVAARPTRIGFVGCGYGDGYPYAAPTGTPVLVNGRRTRLIGRVAMNVLAVELEGLPDVRIGDTATLWGAPELRVGDVARACRMVSEALQCGITKRLPVELQSPHHDALVPSS